MSAFSSGSSGTASIDEVHVVDRGLHVRPRPPPSPSARAPPRSAAPPRRARASAGGARSRARSACSADASASLTVQTGTREVAGDAAAHRPAAEHCDRVHAQGRTPLICGSSAALASGRVRSPARHARVRRRDGARARRRRAVPVPAARRRARRGDRAQPRGAAPARSASAGRTPSRRCWTRRALSCSRARRRGVSRCSRLGRCSARWTTSWWSTVRSTTTRTACSPPRRMVITGGMFTTGWPQGKHRALTAASSTGHGCFAGRSTHDVPRNAHHNLPGGGLRGDDVAAPSCSEADLECQRQRANRALR